MGFLNLFKNKTTYNNTSVEEKIMYFYIYGFVNSNPNFHFKDKLLADKLFKKVIGEKAGIIIGNSFYPYCLIDDDGVSVWEFAYLYLLKNNPNFKEEIKNKELTLLELSSKFNKINLWEDDNRLTFEENPFFGNAVPFIIPFVVFDNKRDTNFDKMILKELKEHQHAQNYIDEITNILKEFMPETTFTLGFDEFKKENKSKMIDNFMAVKIQFGK
jgi:hypothetical protein